MLKLYPHSVSRVLSKQVLKQFVAESIPHLSLL